MKFSRADLYLLMIFSIIYTEAGLNPEKDNVCLKTITYNETIKTGARRPASKREKVICLKENNYCDEETTVGMKKVQVITRTKILPSCCLGYEENSEGTECVPVCPNGCGSGKCVAPGKCSCEAGFFKSECGQMCDEGRWGKNCIFECNCSENEVCNETFGCVCKAGWTGGRCERPCPAGYYGFLCEEKCSCNVNFCDHVTGMCIESKEGLNNLSTGEGSELNKTPRTRSSNVSNASNQKHEIQNHLAESDFPENGTFDKKITTTASEKDEAATPNLPYFKGDEVEEGEKVKELVGAESSVPLREKNFIPEKIFSGNELPAGTVDSQTTSVESEQSSRVSSFIPTFTVLSGVTFIIIFIIGKWLLLIFWKKIKKAADVESGCSDEELNILPSEKFPWESTLENPVFAADILNAVPILQTFKPGVPEIENISAENKVTRGAECCT